MVWESLVPNIKRHFAKKGRFVIRVESMETNNSIGAIDHIRQLLDDYKILSAAPETPTMDEIFIELTK